MSKCAYCDHPVRAKKLCNSHYKKLLKYGDPLAVASRRTRIELYRAKVDVRGPDDCWPWKAHRSKEGYGQFADGNNGSMPAHRYGFEELVRPLEPGEEVDHACHNRDLSCSAGDACEHRACQNPAHWEAVAHRENVTRGRSIMADNSRKTCCKWGHELTPENSYGYKGRRQCKKCARLAARGQHPRQLARPA